MMIKRQVERLLEVFHPKDVKGKQILRWIILILSIYFACAITVYLVENNLSLVDHPITSLGDAFWWAIVTITTVGYGDEFPITTPGRLVGGVLMIFGFVSFSIFTAVIASTMVEDKLKGAQGLKPIIASHHLVVCGWNESTATMLKNLDDRGCKQLIVIVGDLTSEQFANFETRYPALNLKYVRGDFALREVLERASLKTASQVYVFADDNLPGQSADDRAVIVANTIRFISKTVGLTVQLRQQTNKAHLDQIGADHVMIFEEIGGSLLAGNAVEKHSLDVVHGLLSRQNAIATVPLPQGFEGRTYQDLLQHFYKMEGCILIGLLREKVKLEVRDIFTDDGSAIDAFIKQALEHSRGGKPEQRLSLKINPPGDTVVRGDELAVLLR